MVEVPTVNHDGPVEGHSFDGLWHLQNRNAKNVTSNDFVETKMIGGGHFIWLQRSLINCETQKHFGFGTIEVNDDGSATETGMTSSLEGYAGTQHRLKLTFIDDNHFSQTFMTNDIEVTQTYQRM